MTAVVGENMQYPSIGITEDHSFSAAGRSDDLMDRLQVAVSDYFHSPRLNVQYGRMD